MRFSWTFKRRLAALSGVVMILQGAGLAQAQFAPISNPSQIYGQQTTINGQTQAVQRPSYNQPQVYGSLNSSNLTQQPNYQAAPQQNYAQAPRGYVQNPQTGFSQTQQQNYAVAPQQTLVQPQQPRVAYNPAVTQGVAPTQSIAPTQPLVQTPVVGQAQPTSLNTPTTQAASQPQAQPRYMARAFQDSAAGTPTEIPAAGVAPMPADGAQTAPVADYNGDIGYNTFAQGCGIGGCRPRCRRWFGGIYGLMMERDNSDCVPLAFATTSGGPGYYPTDSEIALTTENVDIGFQSGIEIRFGATFGGRLARACGIGGGGGVGYNTFAGGDCCGPAASCCGPTLAWESVYWGIVEDDETSVVTDTLGDSTRTYGMMDFRGLEYNGGSGYRSVNDYFDYGPPTTDNTTPTDIEVRSFTARSTFSAQNLELNLLRLPILNGCGGGCRQRYELTTLVGIRYLRLDEDFYFRSDFEDTTTNATGFLASNTEVDNQLYGLQFGCNGLCRFGCCGRWALHCNTAVGVYGNRVDVHQFMDIPTGGVLRFANGANGAYDITSSKDDVSMLGELRIGGSYQYSCNWRFYSGWRVLGISGIGLATNQVPTAFVTPDQVGKVASNGSMILHGLQAGVECTY